MSMRIQRMLELFNEKGYYIIEEIDNRFYNEKTISNKEVFLSEIEKSLNSFNYDKIRFINDDQMENLSPYRIYFDKSKVSIHIIQDLKTYVDTIIKINHEIEKQNIYNNKYSYTYYRGHSNWKFLLQPSIYRKENENLLKNEDRVFRDIVASKPHFFNDCNTTLDMLVKMQHHGMPTRLLDLTDNPLISLFFACNDNNDGNKEIHGEITVFNVPQEKFKYYDSDTVSVLANISKCNNTFDISHLISDDELEILNEYYAIDERNKIDKYIENIITEFNAKKSISELVHFIREDKPYFLPKVVPIHLNNFSTVVKPKMAIDRIINQSGAFVLLGIKKTKNICADFNINTEGYKQNVLIIPSVFKKGIIKELKLFNINESTVYCDFDSTAKFFKDEYK